MQLTCNKEALKTLFQVSYFNPHEAILERRDVLRQHRDAVGDDRCFLDDYLVWKMIVGIPSAPRVRLNMETGMSWCTEFYNLRRTEHPDPISIETVPDPLLWNTDLPGKDSNWLIDELGEIQKAIWHHFETAQNRPLTAEDDRLLYSVLPEKVPADFRLPPREEFLGEAKAPHAGCPAFWRSHKNCLDYCNQHSWGPCRRPCKQS